ncbi:MAG TPA: flagellar hook-length control protein FliK [Nitrospiraceae bacterium]|nr:flagellar hook-length control protein FliK [Nitrospiraceae bacterium]
MAEQDQRIEEGDQRTEEHETNGGPSADVMIALCVALADQTPSNGEPEPASDNTDALVITIESATASAQVIVDLTAGQPTASSLMKPGAQQQLLGPAEVQDGSAQSKEPPPALPASNDPRLPQAGEQGGLAAIAGMMETQPSTDPATVLSNMPAHGDLQSKNETLSLSHEASLPGDAPFTRNATNPIETWQQGDHPATDGMVEHRPPAEWFQFNGGQEEAMGRREDQAAGSRTEPSQAGQHPAPREGFGETIATVAADRAASPQGGGHRTDGITGRGTAISWPQGDEGRPMVQAVSLDLEPADLGPINVRIFLSDRTVHAHIRTDQMDLGQGMLSQQQQLEHRLQSSGLEMGEFKVTVDQQQLSRGDSQGWLGQQSDRHASMVDPVQRAAEADMREPLSVERRRHTGIVSYFA